MPNLQTLLSYLDVFKGTARRLNKMPEIRDIQACVQAGRHGCLYLFGTVTKPKEN